ncbi:MAG TPA: VIT1/CCC1 transporter family protein [Rhizomicrobium sp.]|nr:VIT1/CCC1 transporter family protein [Rhizomicrobium sp.]
MADKDARRYRENLQGEVDGAALYEALADSEKDERLSGVYRRLAAVERAHAEFWTKALEMTGEKPNLRPSTRARIMAWLSRRLGAAAMLPVVAGAEAHDIAHYDNQPDAVKAGLPNDERSHARIIQAVARSAGGLPGQTLAQLEGRHRGGGGNALRAAVLGANDGLVSNMSLVMGVAGGAADSRTILLTGLAGLVAGACSMAMGEWLSVNSSRELTARQIETEREELMTAPELEREELELIYQSKGLSQSTAKSLADRVFSNKDAALDTLVREELGIDPEGLGGSAYAAAASSFALFAAGAVVPVIPFFAASGDPAVYASIGLSGVALALSGAVTSLFTGRSILFSAIRQLLIGYLAAAITFGIGHAIGVSIS